MTQQRPPDRTWDPNTGPSPADNQKALLIAIPIVLLMLYAVFYVITMALGFGPPSDLLRDFTNAIL